MKPTDGTASGQGLAKDAFAAEQEGIRATRSPGQGEVAGVLNDLMTLVRLKFGNRDPDANEVLRRAATVLAALSQPEGPQASRSILDVIEVPGKTTDLLASFIGADEAAIARDQPWTGSVDGQGNGSFRPQASGGGETGWLIEAWNSKTGEFKAEWWSATVWIETGEGGWTKDSTAALRFAREQDARAYIAEVGWTDAKPTEHGWGLASPAPVVTGSAERDAALLTGLACRLDRVAPNKTEHEGFLYREEAMAIRRALSLLHPAPPLGSDASQGSVAFSLEGSASSRADPATDREVGK